MRLYKYLDEHAHVDSWLRGGKIPLKQARHFRELEQTSGRADSEDAMRRRIRGVTLKELDGLVVIDPGAECNIIGTNLVLENESTTRGFHALEVQIRFPPMLMLCLSTRLSQETARSISPTCRYCVRIMDLEALRARLDHQLKATSEVRAIEYTSGDDRGPFLKSAHLAQQYEFRLAWPGVTVEGFWASVPDGIAEEVAIPS